MTRRSASASTSGSALDRVHNWRWFSITFNLFLYFVALWSWPLNFQPQNHKTCPKAIRYTKFEDSEIVCFWVIVLQTDRQTDRQNHKQTDAAKRFTPATVVGVSDEWHNTSSVSVVSSGWTVHQCRQEGRLSPTERASVSAISLRHNLATSGESRRYVVAFTRFAAGGIWLPQERLRHILPPLCTPLEQSR